MMSTPSDLFGFLLALADDALVLGHRLSEWSGQGPTLEEDIALSNLGLDLIGQARLFYAYAGEVEDQGRDEDRLAYFREAQEFRNAILYELPKGDFAFTIVRQLVHAAFMVPYYGALTQSSDARLASIAAKAVKEMRYHVRHAAEWTIRLGDGTEESHRRMQAALQQIQPWTTELLMADDGERRLVRAGIAPDRGHFRARWSEHVNGVLAEAQLPGIGELQGVDARPALCGRTGRHTEHLPLLLADMQSLARAHPEAVW